MIRHIVLFRLKREFNPAEKAIALEIVRKELLALKAKIPVIREWEIGTNISLENPLTYDIGINSLFETPEDLHAYQIHPDHQAFIRFNASYSEHKVILDYTI